MIKIEVFVEYLKTVLFTIFVMVICLIILMAVVQHQVYENLSKVDAQDEKVEYYLIGVLIDKNKYLESQYPENYKINLKLGILYEIYKDYPNSEAQYKLAMAKSPYDDFHPDYKLALLYLKMGRLDESQQVMDNITERPLKKLILEKADLYNRLGDAYYALGNYTEAIARYQKSITYYSIIKSTKVKEVKESLASAYVYSAEEHVANYKIESAITALKAANSLVKAPILKYKLALLLVKNEPELAYKYFDSIFKEEPTIINFDMYYNFLSAMANEADQLGNPSLGALYRYKAKRFKDYYEKNILSVNDVSVEIANGQMVYSRWKKKYTINLELQFKNTTETDLNSLFLNVVFKDDEGVIAEYFAPIVDAKSKLKARKEGPIINIKTVYQLKDKYSPNKNISAEIFVSKLEDSYKLSLATVKIKEVKRIKRHKKNWNYEFKSWLNKIYSIIHAPKKKVEFAIKEQK